MGSSPFILALAEERAQSSFPMPFGVFKRSRVQKADYYALEGVKALNRSSRITTSTTASDIITLFTGWLSTCVLLVETAGLSCF